MQINNNMKKDVIFFMKQILIKVGQLLCVDVEVKRFRILSLSVRHVNNARYGIENHENI